MKVWIIVGKIFMEAWIHGVYSSLAIAEKELWKCNTHYVNSEDDSFEIIEREVD